MFNIKDFFNNLLYKDYVVLKLSDDFPDYKSGSDIDILCGDIDEFMNSLFIYTDAVPYTFDVRVDANNERTHFDIYINNEIDLRFDLRDHLFYNKFIVNDNYNRAILDSRRCIIRYLCYVSVPSEAYDVAIRLMEFIEYPNKLKHLEFLNRKIND